jgi:hypothetical protein
MRLCLLALCSCVLLISGCSASYENKAANKLVSIALYEYPSDWKHELPPEKLGEAELRELRQGKIVYSAKLDLSRGIPVSAFATQHRLRGRFSALTMRGSITHAKDDWFLNFLPRPLYREVGWIDWFLLRRDEKENVVEIVTIERGQSPRQKKSLIEQAQNGDELIGGWGF